MMRPAYSHRSLVAPDYWQELPHGEWLQQQVDAGLANWWPKIFGYHLLKLGALSQALHSQLCPVQHQFSLDPNQGSVRGELTELPFQNASIDACLTTFCLEFQRDPHKLLREVDRVLVSGGHLVLVGFNPLSPLALGYISPQHRNTYPWNGRLFSPARIQDWLSVLGYQVVAKECLVHSSLLMSPERFPSMQRWMADYCQGLGSVYLVVARKLEHPLTPIRPKWILRPALVGQQVAEAVGRQGAAARDQGR